MKRVICLLLCAVLLMGLLPAAALADGELPMYFEECSEYGNVSDEGRVTPLHTGYGATVYFRVYTAETGGEAITGDQLHLYENNEDVTGSMLTWIPSENNGYYRWDTHAVKTANPVFLASVDDQDYEGITQVHEADIGWFSSDSKSLSSALTFADKTAANVFYDGSKRVTVYLLAEFNVLTSIAETTITKSDGLQYHVFERTNIYNGNTPCGDGLAVTCPAGLSGDLTLSVSMRYRRSWEPETETKETTYTVTFSKTGKKPDGDTQSRPGEPTAIKVKIKDKEEVCWFGVGTFKNNKFDILSNSSMGNPADTPNYAILAVGLWRMIEGSNGSWDLTMLSPEEVEEVMTQADFKLNFYPQSGQAADPPEKKQLGEIKKPEYPYDDLIQAAAAAAETGMPEAACYPLEARHEGMWRVEAVCKMKGTEETYTAWGNLERRVLNNVELTGCSTVEEINNALKQEIKKLQDTSSDKRRETNICVWMSLPNYTGQIDVPEISQGLMKVGVNVEFIGVGQDEESGMPKVELQGGIRSENVPIAVQWISFVGAGKQDPEDSNSKYLEYWPAEGVHKGAENSALYGLSAATASHCSFTDYYYAMKLTEGMRLCGSDNTYVGNHIAWYLGKGNYNGGNPAANNCVFERNDYAIWIEKFNLRPSFYAPSRCQFIDNKLDIQNDSGRAWFIPGNYFVHGPTDDGRDYLATAIDPATLVNCYPLCRREIINGKERDVFYYNYTQLGRNEIYQLANRLASTYRTPLAYLDGKTFEVVDEDSAQPLATFSFDSADSPAQRRAPAARRSIARFSAEEEKSFDATVRVDRTDKQIDFTMNDPCRSVTVKLPCEFKYGTVTHTLNGKSEQLETVRFDGETVSFETSEGGDYTIEYRPSGGFIVAGYDDQRRLVGVQFVSSKVDPVTITAPTIKYFAIDRSYRPLDEVVIPRR